MTTSKSSLFHAGLFRKHNFGISQFKHLTPKSSSLGISKMWSTICLESSLLKINKTVQMFYISVNFKDTKIGTSNFGIN